MWRQPDQPARTERLYRDGILCLTERVKKLVDCSPFWIVGISTKRGGSAITALK